MPKATKAKRPTKTKPVTRAEHLAAATADRRSGFVIGDPPRHIPPGTIPQRALDGLTGYERWIVGHSRDVAPEIAVVDARTMAICDLCDEGFATLGLAGCNGHKVNVCDQCLREAVKLRESLAIGPHRGRAFVSPKKATT